MRHPLKSSFVALLFALGACASDQGSFRNAITGEACEPNDSFVPVDHGKKGEHGNGGHDSPTGIPGDNMDDESSGKIDCLGDGDSGQGNDDKNCVPPGCDDEGCCEEPDDDVDDPDDDGSGDDGSGDDGSGDDGSGDDGSGDDGSGDEPTVGDPSIDEPAADEDVLDDPAIDDGSGSAPGDVE